MNLQEHLLTCLGEEGSEIAQDIAKCLRFGLDDRNVLKPTGPTNRERLVAELNDLLGVAAMLEELGILPDGWQNFEAQYAKRKKVEKFLDYARHVRALTGTGYIKKRKST
jgi:hypothetical protein